MVLVSTVIPTRGRPELLLRAVNSVLAQTLREIEVVIVIDGEDRATELALERLVREDRRVNVVALGSSVGGSDARNRGVDAASGEWIAFLDDDDEWLPGKLQAQLEAVTASTAPVVIGTCKIIARTPGNDYVWPRRLPKQGEPICEYLLARRTLSRGEGSIQTSTFFVRRALMKDQPFKSGQLKHQDTEWLLRVGQLPGAEAVFVNDVMAIHYIEEERVSVSSKANWRYSLEWVRRDRHLFTPRALTGFVLHQIAPEASEQGEWRAFPMLFFDVLRHGKSEARDFAIFLAMWLLPRRRRRRLRDWMARRPALRPLVHSR
ncbi:glycosyltransferase family 2 protein [Granulicella arctica]|uniref:Glycosyltransferase involved in cell wall biosynthesis n=1 Tax=Granulicella arctica TaxID=940613 RepID=A0A7Y9PGS1_9BACT|nr:glycosyltransferase family 2 protein [Granulicella arctica]NYF79609.1 glycosyltransferase involved in cell wall biosynthesis [Granulicella arctica]